MFDTPNPYFMREYSHFWMSLASYRDDLNRLHWTEYPGWAIGKVCGLIDNKAPGLRVKLGLSNGVSQKVAELGPLSTRIQAAAKYRPAPYTGRFLVVKRTHRTGRYRHPSFGWSAMVNGKVDVCKVSSLDHNEIFKAESDRAAVAQALNPLIDEVIAEFSRQPNSASHQNEEIAGVPVQDVLIRSESPVTVGTSKCTPQVI
jgi:hypothetical protein